MEIEKGYLNNEQVEKETWELVGINVKLNKGNADGYVELRFAYRPDEEDTFKIKDKEVILTKVFPNYVKKQIVSFIKASLPGAKYKPVKKVKETPTPITITRIIKRKLNKDE